MKNNNAALRYAKAILEHALEQATADSLEKDAKDIVDVCSDSKELMSFLNNPIIPIDLKKDTLFKIFTSFCEDSKRMINLLANNNRISLLYQVAQQFITLYQAKQGKQTVVVTTAIPITKTLEQGIYNKVKELFSSNLTLTNVIDPSIIGGFILSIGDLQYNASVSQKLNTLKRELTQNNIAFK